MVYIASKGEPPPAWTVGARLWHVRRSGSTVAWTSSREEALAVADALEDLTGELHGIVEVHGSN